MMHCWNKDLLQRPNFTQLREHLEEIMSQESRYLSFDIDEKNVYYNVASFKRLPSKDENDIDIEEEIPQKPVHIKTIEQFRKEKEANGHNLDIGKTNDAHKERVPY